MKLYLAHNFDARNYLNIIVKPKLEAAGHIITSRWIWDDFHLDKGSGVISAQHDLEDIENSNGIILFVDQYAERPGRGKFVELGYAIRAGKKTFLIGSNTDCVFYNLSIIVKFDTIDDFIASRIPY